MLVSQFIFGAILVCVTVVIHALTIDGLMALLTRYARLFQKSGRVFVLITTVSGVFAAHIVQIWIWAFFYLYVGSVPNFESALYFSTSTFTTVGFGDIVLDERWRLISSFQSANGFILFGWSTAFIFEVMYKIYRDGLDGDPK